MSGGDAAPQYRIRQIGAGEYEAVQALHAAHFPAGNFRLQRAWWDWQYQRNPAIDDGQPPAWVAETQHGDLVAHCGAIVVPLHCDHRIARAVWTVDLFVLPPHRRAGLGVQLVRAQYAKYDWTAILGANPASFALFSREQWHDYGNLTRFLRPLHAGHLLRRYLPLGFVAQAAGKAASAAATAFAHRKGSAGVEVRRVERYGEDVSALWDRLATQLGAAMRRDARYLNWRYADHPGLRYVLWQAERRGEAAGFLVGRRDPRAGYTIGSIVDLAGDQAALCELITAAVEDFRRDRRTAFADAYVTLATHGQALRRCGFVGRRSPKHFMVRPCTPGWSLPPAEQWLISKGDSDQDRER